ncbi:hypothetical protein LSTR_LSTR000110 [Laodelphax striatellus]|uniref:Calponin-homology (CH) domain-containing protein n=1 Tax=Laodelphax striatellus TaxID=195883 RepID=A0A482X6X9_LAOST|nr:hypothetical protein LSTR_LSTR000110 [Laodelphax striatellus]
MKNIILGWLNDDLKLDVTQKYVTGSFKNGVLIARILYSYKIINDRILDEMIKGADAEEYFSNLIKLSYWMKLLGINFSLDTIKDLIAGKGTASMQIMYQIYLSLNTKMYRSKLGDIRKRQEEYIDWCYKNVRIENSSSAQSCLQHQDVKYNGSNTVQNSIETNYFHRNVSGVDDIDGDSGGRHFSYSHKSCTSTEQDKSRKIIKFDHSKTESEYITLIKNNLAKDAGREDMKSRLNKNIMNQVWINIDKKCEDMDNLQYSSQTLPNRETVIDYGKKISKKNLPRPTSSKGDESKKEKKTLQKEKKARAKNNKILDNSNNVSLIHQQYTENKQIDWPKRDSEQNYMSDEIERIWSYNSNRKLEQHRKLWNKRIKLQKICRYNICKNIIEYCIDSAIQQTEESLKSEALPRINDHDEFFLTKSHSSHSNLESSSEIPVLNITTRKYQRHKECSYNEYFYLTGDWFDQKLLAGAENFRDDGDNNNIVLGCIIYSLFDSDDTRLRPSKLKKYPISCVVSNPSNGGLLRKCLQAVLGKSSILVVDRETAIDYCKNIYTENLPHPPSSKGNKSKKEKKTRAKKSSKKSIRNQSIHNFKDQEVQVDGVPDADDLNHLNECIRNGQDISDCLRTKNVFGSDLVVKCVASVLKSHQNRLRGWVAVNFPSSYEETCLFENYLAGRNTITRRDNNPENVRSTFQAESLRNSSAESDEKHPYYSVLIPNLSLDDNHFITKYISMMHNEKRPGEERGSERIDRRESKSVDLENHFRKLEIFHELKYDKLDMQMIIDLANFIITVPDGNFGYEIDENALTLSLDIGKPPSTKKSKKSRKNPQNPEVNPFLPDQNKISTEDFSRNYKPGDANWVFFDCSLPSDMRLYLIQLWQLTESSYLDSLDKLFASFHKIEEKVNLYWKYVEEKVRKRLFNNEERNLELKNFTEKHNIVPSTQNQLDKMKKGTGCDALISRLLFKLWQISDLKRKDAEDIITKLLDDSATVVGLMKNFWNIFETLMLVEMQKCIRTLIIIQHYYFTALEVKNIDSILFFDNELKTILSNIFDEPDWKDNSSIETFIVKHSDLFIHTAQELAKLVNKKRKKLEIDLANSTSIFALPISKVTALLNEWEAAADYEIQRLFFRISIIKRKALFDIISLNDIAKELNLELSSLIEEIFLQDDNCCANFSAQIDNAHKDNICITGSFEFIGNEYYFRRKLTNCEEFKQEVGLVITPSKYFTLAQLEKMSIHLKALAPSRRIDRISLSFLLDDWNHKKSNRMLPDYWCDLTRQQIYDILESISSKNGTVDWKDFLLFGTLEAYPSKAELLTQYKIFINLDSQQLGTISFEDFANHNTLWFGSSQIDGLKKLLFWIFKTEDDRFDYHSFLMKLCKDEDPALGFGKALSLSYNRCVVVTDEDINLKRSVEEYRECTLKIVKQILDQVVLDVINLTENALLYEYHDFEQDNVPLWWKLGRLPIASPFKSSASPLPAIEGENLPINQLQKLDWTKYVPSELLIKLLEEERDTMRMQCTENIDKFFNENCTRLKNKELINVAHILRKDPFIVDQISKDTRFKAISLPNLINKENKEKNISM